MTSCLVAPSATLDEMESLGPPLGEKADDVDLDLLAFLWSLTPAERLRRLEQALELVRALRSAGIRHYGFDPRSPPQTR